MEFRLTYDGELVQSGGADHKHEVRKAFHRQLKRLWQIHPILVYWSTPPHAPEPSPTVNPPPGTPGNASYLEALANDFQRGNYRYAPLATAKRGIIVSLDILFLRTGQPGSLIKSADLDARIKTLIDALRMPEGNQELGKYLHPDADEDPFFCVMQDDKLVGNISITADVLLEPTPGSHGHGDLHDSRVVVAVSLRSYASGAFATVWM